MRTITQGESSLFTVSSALGRSPEWTAKLFLTDAENRHEFEMTADGSGGWSVELTPAQTGGFTEGIKDFAVQLKNGLQIAYASRGRLEVLSDPTVAGDKRTQSEKDLEAVEGAIRAIIEGGAVASYQIQTTVGSRQLTRMSLDDLEKLRRRLRIQCGIVKPPKWRAIKSCLGGHGRKRRGR